MSLLTRAVVGKKINVMDLPKEEREMILGKPVADALEDSQGAFSGSLEVVAVDHDNKTVTLGAITVAPSKKKKGKR